MTGEYLTERLERHLGEIRRGWRNGPDGERMPFQVVEFDGPVTGARTYVTLGLSHHDLACPPRLELLTAAYDEFAPLLPNVLRQLGEEMIEIGHPFLRGQCIGPRGPLFDGTAVEAIFLTHPAYWPEEIDVHDGVEGQVLVAWTVPVTAGEAAFVNEHGRVAFENLLAEHDPDLLDMRRPSITG